MNGTEVSERERSLLLEKRELNEPRRAAFREFKRIGVAQDHVHAQLAILCGDHGHIYEQKSVCLLDRGHYWDCARCEHPASGRHHDKPGGFHQ